MKKLFIVGIILAISYATAAGQKFSGYLKLGLVGSQVDGDDDGGYHKLGIVAGPIVKIKFTKKTGIESGVYYISKGAKRKANISAGDYNYFRTHFDYVEVPILVNFFISPKFSLDVGTSFAYLFNAKMEDAVGLIDKTLYNLNSWDYNTHVGANFHYTDRFYININFSYSLYSITDTNKTKSWYNNVLQLSLIYKLKKSEKE